MKVIIAGSRTITNYEYLLKAISNANLEIDEIVSGGARGADTLGERYALENNIPLKIFTADWNRYGNSAGPIRNKEMAEYADALIILWDGKSLGSKSMLDFAKSRNLQIYVYIPEEYLLLG